jgi:hypothetical protein
MIIYCRNIYCNLLQNRKRNKSKAWKSLRKAAFFIFCDWHLLQNAKRNKSKFPELL